MVIITIWGSPLPYGDPRKETGMKAKKLPFGDSPYGNGVRGNLGTDTYTQTRPLWPPGLYISTKITYIEPHPGGARQEYIFFYVGIQHWLEKLKLIGALSPLK